MSIYATTPRRSSRARNPHNDRHHRADFARLATIEVLGWRYARALDQGNFIDRLPGDMPKSSPEARFR